MEPWGGAPWGGSLGAWQHQVGVLRDEVVGPHGEAGVLHGEVGGLQGACLAEEAQSELQDVVLGVVLDVVLGVGQGGARSGAQGGALAPVVPGLVPEQQQRLQPAAPSADEPSSLRTSAAPCGRPGAQ